MATDFNDVFQGKRVVVVGPAGCLFNDCKNIDVDSFDIVSRINGHYKMCKKHGNIIGKRTDVLYHAFESFQYDTNDIQTWNNTDTILVSRDANPVKLKRVKTMGYNKYIDNIPFKMLQKYRKELQSNPSTGVLAIFHALSFKASEVYAVGFDFYQTLYQTKNDNNLRYKIIENKIGNHNPRRQLEQFKRVMENCKNFHPIGKLKDLMKNENKNI